MQNRARRCGHGFYDRLCVVASCEHYDGGEPASPPPLPRSRQSRGAGAAVRLVLLDTPQLSNSEVASLCGCSRTLVGMVRRALGLQRRKRKPQR